MKFALEIRTTEVQGKFTAWFCRMFETEKELDEAVNIIWDLKEDFKKTHIIEVEYVTHLDRVHGRI